MLVNDLIEKLKTLPQDAEVLLVYNSCEWGSLYNVIYNEGTNEVELCT